jgi:hypothetical protein
MSSALRKIPFARTLAVVAAVMLVYVIAAYAAAPRLIERALEDYAAERPSLKVTVGQIRVNPFLFKLEATDFALAERSGAPVARFKRLLVDFELSSLLRWAWTFAAIRIEGLELHADIRPDGTLNLAALADSFRKEARPPGDESAPPTQPARLLLRDVTLSDASVVFSDRSDPTPAMVTLKPINLRLHELSTLPDRRGQHSVSMRLPGGGMLNLRGETSLQPIASQGLISVKGGRPATAWRFLRDETDLAEPTGSVDISARYRFSYSDGEPRLAIQEVRAQASGIAVKRSGAEEPMLALESIEVRGGRFNPIKRELALAAVELRKGDAAVHVDPEGIVNWQKVFTTPVARKPDRKPDPGAGNDDKPWTLKIDAVRVSGVALRYTDQSRAAPIAVSAGNVDTSFGAEFQTRSDGTQVLLRDVGITLARVAAGAASAGEPLATLDAVALQGGTFDLENRSIAIQRVSMNGGAIRIVRESDGRLPLAELMRASDAGKLRREVEAAVERSQDAGRPWRFVLEAVDFDDLRVALADRGFGEAITYDVEGLRGRIESVGGEGDTPARFEAKFRVAQGGSGEASGTIHAASSLVAGRMKINGLDLKPLHPMVARHTALRLESGWASADASLEYRWGKVRPALRLAGAAGIDRLLLNEADSGERFLAWKSLAAKGVSFSPEPAALRIEEVRLVEPGAKLVIFKDRTLNVARILQPPTQPNGGAQTNLPEAGARKQVPDPAKAAEPASETSVGSIQLEKGVVDFSDLSLVLPYAARIEDLGGSVSGVSSDPSSRATLKLDGRVGEFGLARVNGSIHLFKPKAFTDLVVTFRNVPMPPLSPYSATFAGRKIAAGRLTLDVRYKVEDGKLAGENKVAMQKFTLGERVKAPGALDLPLDLAVALLTDAKGGIDIAVPVRGNVDDPKFSYGQVVGQAIANAIVGIVAAPFKLLGALFGGTGENLDTIDFDPGVATLQPPEREKLGRVAEALAKRPQLRLTMEGQYGEADRAALRQREIALAVAAKLGRTPDMGKPDPVNPTDARTQRALEALFIERHSEQGLARFATDSGKTRGKPVQRVNPLAAAGPGSPDAAFYEALVKRLVDTIPVTDEALRTLAGARARAVAAHLVKTLAVPAARVEPKAGVSAGGERVKLAIDILRQGAS